MAIVTATAFRRAILTQLLPLLPTFWLRLYVNDYTATPSSNALNFAEPSGSWYSPVILDQWGPPYITAALQARIDNVIRTFTAGGTVVAESVYGYWVTDPVGSFVWAERAPLGPYPMDVVGQVVRVLPRLTDGLLC